MFGEELDKDLQQRFTLIHRKTDGTGVVKLMGRQGNMNYFGFDQYPNGGWGNPPVEGGGEPLYMPRITRVGANGVIFRIAHGWTEGRTKPDMATFRLSGNALVETFQVITDFLRVNHTGWFQLRNKHGNPLNKGCFSSDD